MVYPEFGRAVLAALENHPRARSQVAPGVYAAKGGILQWVGGVIKDIAGVFNGRAGRAVGGVLCALVPPTCAVVVPLLADSAIFDALTGNRRENPPETRQRGGWSTAATPEGGTVAWPGTMELGDAARAGYAIYWTPGLPAWIDARLLPFALE